MSTEGQQLEVYTEEIYDLLHWIVEFGRTSEEAHSHLLAGMALEQVREALTAAFERLDGKESA